VSNNENKVIVKSLQQLMCNKNKSLRKSCLIDLYYRFFDWEKGRGRGWKRWRVWFWLENGGGEVRMMARLTKKKIGIQDP
jgi:hypothetical protein